MWFRFHRLFPALAAILTFAATIIPAGADAQELNTQGRDFWVSFLPNFPDSIPKLEILVAGEKPCSGTVLNPLTGWSTQFTVMPGAVTSVTIPNAQGFMEKENTVEQKALHVTTTEDVSLYASNFYPTTYDVSNVLPTNVLKDNYLAYTYSGGEKPGVYSKMLIVGVENQTEITVRSKGGLKGPRWPIHRKTISLNAGECYLFYSATGDMTGTSVNVKDGKKAAVFCGGDIRVPAGNCCYDAVFEQCIPLAYWGKEFVVTASKMRNNDIVRILSLASGCKVSIDGQNPVTLGAGLYYDYKLDGTVKEAVHISASSPVSVCLYLTSAMTGGRMGDPSMVNITPIEQKMGKVTFATYNTTVSEYHFVNVVTQTDQTQYLTLDGTPISSEFKPVPQKAEFSYARIQVAHGSHTLEATEGGFVAHIYGLGEYESYAYSAGSNSKMLNRFNDSGELVLNDVPREEVTPLLPEPEPEPEPEPDPEPIPQPAPTIFQVRTDTLSPLELTPVPWKGLLREEPFTGVVEDLPEGGIDPCRYTITVKSKQDYLFEGFDVVFEGDSVYVTPHPRGEWCGCFVPDQLDIDVILTPEEESLDRIVIPMAAPVAKEESWFARCLWALALTVGLFLLILYLLALLRKKRFKKTASVNPVYYNRHGEEVDDGVGLRLRARGLAAWFARWFLPGRERRRLSFNDPECSFTFLATDSPDVVEISRKDIDPETVSADGIDLDYMEGDASRPVRLGPSGQIYIRKPNAVRLEGYLTFLPGSENDGAGWRMFLSLIILASAAAIGALAYFMFRGIL